MPTDFHMGSGERCPSELQPARASRLLAGAGAPGLSGSTGPHTCMPAVSENLEQSCSPRRSRVGIAQRGEGRAVGCAPGIWYYLAPLRQSCHSLQPARLTPSLLFRRERRRRRMSWSKAAAHAETTSGHRTDEKGVRSAAHMRRESATIWLRLARACCRFASLLACSSAVSHLVAGAGAELQPTPRLHRVIAARRWVCGRRRT